MKTLEPEFCGPRFLLFSNPPQLIPLVEVVPGEKHHKIL